MILDHALVIVPERRFDKAHVVPTRASLLRAAGRLVSDRDVFPTFLITANARQTFSVPDEQETSIQSILVGRVESLEARTNAGFSQPLEFVWIACHFMDQASAG
jgi:hypothetical protein